MSRLLSGSHKSSRVLTSLGVLAIAMASCKGAELPNQESETNSLTDSDYAGKKYYFGWGQAAGADPEFMKNEVKYDVLHTHDIFTNGVGGNYVGTKLVDQNFQGAQIKEEWNKLKSVMGKDDMFVQYSSGHGLPTYLAVGVTYDEISSTALSLPAKEIVMLTMACHSGGLVDSFNQKKSQWQNWAQEGRTLFVMSSSTVQEISKSGPSVDSQEKAGVQGSAGSAYGHAVWKALIGEADGYLDGVRDGFISLGELGGYVVAKTKQITYNQTPQITGVYNPALIMNKVPSAAYASQYADPTAGMSLEQTRKYFQDADEEIATTVAKQGL